MGDCDDSAILLTSLLRNFVPEDRLFATVGLFGRWGGHICVTALSSGAFVLEATLAEALPGPWVIPEEETYIPFLRFNDRLEAVSDFHGKLVATPMQSCLRWKR